MSGNDRSSGGVVHGGKLVPTYFGLGLELDLGLGVRISAVNGNSYLHTLITKNRDREKLV